MIKQIKSNSGQGKRGQMAASGRKRAVLAAACLAGFTSSAFAQTSAVWTFLGNGSWNDVTNWAGGVPAGGGGGTADFSTLNLTTDQTVTLDTNQSINAAIFGDTGLATNNWIFNAGTPGGALNLIAPATLTVNSQSATINALVVAASGFTKAGGGTLVLNNNNVGITGIATLSAGNTALGNDGAFGTGTIAFTGGNILAVTTPRVLTNQIEMLGTANVVTGQAVTLNGQINVTGGDRTLNFGTNQQIVQTGTIGGTINLSEDGLGHTFSLGGTNGNVNVTGTITDGAAAGAGTLNINPQFGTVTLSGNNSAFTGTTVFNAGQFGTGTLIIANNNALGTGTFFLGSSTSGAQFGGNILINSDITLANTFEINGGQNDTLYGTGDLTLNGTLNGFGQARKFTNNLASNKQLILNNTLNITADGSVQQLRIDGTGTMLLKGNVSGSGASSLQFSSSGAMILQGNSNNFGGFLSLQSGTVQLDMPHGGVWGGGSLALGADTDNNAFSTPTFVVTGPAAGATINLTGNIGIGGSDSRIIVDTSAGAATINASGLARGTSAGVLDVTLTPTGSLTLAASTLQNGLLPYVTINSGADFATTSGTLLTAFTGYNAYTTGTFLNNAGSNALLNTAAASIALATGTTNLSTIANKATGSIGLAMQAGQGTFLNLGTIGTILSAPSAGTLVIGATANTSTLNAGGSTANTAGELIFINNSTNNQIINSAIANNGTAAVAVSKSGKGSTLLNGSGFYTGALTVNGGTLIMGTATALGTGTTPTVNGGGTLDLNGTSLSVNSIGGSDGVIADSGAVTTLTIGNNSASVAFGDSLMGNVRLVKTGTGSIIMNLPNSTNVGGASLNGGTLRIGSGNALGSGTITFNGGTLMIAGAGGVMNNAFNVASVSNAFSTYREEQVDWTQNGALTGNGTIVFTLHPNAGSTVFWNADDSAFTGVFRMDTALINAGNAGVLGGFNFVNQNAGSALARFMVTTDSQGWNAQWAGVGSATIQMGELSSVLGAGTSVLSNSTANTTATYQIGALGTNATFGGSFRDGGDNNSGLVALTKVGSGVFTLTGTGNDFRGGLNVNAGTLQVNANLTGSSVVTINGGTLLANAQLGTGPVVVAGGNMFFNNVATAAHPSVTVNSGTLHFTGNTALGTATGTGLTVNGGGTLDLVDAGINTVTVSSGAGNVLNLGGTGTTNLNFEITGTGGAGAADEVVLANAAGAVHTAGQVKVNVTPFGAWQGSVNSSTRADYTLIHAPGGGINAGSFALGSLPPAFYVAPPDFNDSTSTDLILGVQMAPIPAQAFWKGDLASGLSSFNGSTNVGNWTGGDTTNTNWDTGTTSGTDTHQLPGGSTDVIFSANSATNQTTTIGADLGIKGLELASSSVVSIGGTNALSIGADGLTIDAGAAADSINTATVTLNGNQTWTNNSGNTLTIGAVIGGPFGLTVTRIAGGTGTFQFNNANTYTGGTTINTGAAIKLGNASALGTGILTMNGGTLDLNGLGLTVGALAGNSGTILNGNSAGIATLTFNVGSGVSASSGATIADGAGSVAVVKGGTTGSLTLTGVNSYTGGTTIAGGTLGINADAALGTTNGTTTGTLAFSASGTLSPSGSFAIARPINTGTLTPGGITATLNVPNIQLDLNGPISGNGILNAGISGSGGTVTLSNTTSTFTGTLSVGSGSLVKLNATGVLTSGTINIGTSGTLDLNGKTFSGVVNAQSGTFGNAFNSVGTFASNMPVLTNSDNTHTAIINTNNGTYGVYGNTSAFWQMRGTGNIEIDAPWDQIANSNTANGGLIKYDNSTLTLGGTTSTTLNTSGLSNNQSVLQVGSFLATTGHTADTFQNGGTVVMQKSSTVTAGTTRFVLINSGTVVYGNSVGSITGGSYGGNVGQNNAVTINGQGVLDLNGGSSINTSIGILTVGTWANGQNTGTFAGEDLGNGTITNSAANTATLTFGVGNGNANGGSTGLVQSVFSANIRDGVGTLALVKTGSGTAAFGTQNSENSASFANGAASVVITDNPGNTFSGGLYLNAGSFYAASDDALGTGTLGLNGGAFAAFSTISHTFSNPVGLGGASNLGDATRTGSLQFNGNVYINANSTLTVNSVATFSAAVNNGGTFINNGGTISPGGVFNLTKAGASTLTLGGVNTYTGTTSVTAGTLAFTNSNGLNSTPLVNISGGTLSVPGSFSTPSSLTIAGTGGAVSGAYTHGAGTISPGSGNGNLTAGTVSFANGLTLNAGGATFIDLNGAATTGSDQVAVTGALAMNGGKVEVNFLTAPTGLPRTYTIMTDTTQSGAVGNLTVESRANLSVATTTTAVNVTVNSYTAGNLTWSGLTSGNGLWDLSTTTNWTNAASGADKFFQLDNVNFADQPATVQTAVNLNTQVFPASVTINNTNTAYTVSGNGTISGAIGVTKQGSGSFTITANTNYTGTTSVQGGRLVLGPKAWGPALTIAGATGADVRGGRLVYDYTGTTTPAATVSALLKTGYGLATKFSTGLIHDSTATATGLGLGWADDGVSQVSVVQTYYGDATLDGTVNILDFNAVAASYGATGKVWTTGDFNYDGSVNVLDLNAIATNFGLSTSVPAAPPILDGALPSSIPSGLGSLVPEPASIGLIGLGLTLVSRRTRRNRNGNRNS